MNFVAIDPSLISTGMCINSKVFNYCREKDALTSKGKYTKWFSYCDNILNIRYVNYEIDENYSKNEIFKLRDYNVIADSIIKDIKENINPLEETKVIIEGYSYGSQAGDLIDLVAFSTILRTKIYENITKDILVISPSTLKQEACKLTYKPINVGKKVEKWEYRNTMGISGGSFSKLDMYYAIIENEKLNDEWALHCKQIKDDIILNKNIKKPYEDVNDAYIMYHVLKNGNLK